MTSGSKGKHPSQRSTTERTRLLGVGAFLVIAILFAILNLHTVSVNWIVTTTHTALTLVIVVAFLLGAGVGALITRRRVGSGGPSRSRPEH